MVTAERRGAATLLTTGDYLDGEISGPSRVVRYQEVDLWRAVNSSRINRNLIRHDFSFAMVRAYGTHLLAKQAALGLSAALPTDPSNLVITSTSSGAWTLTLAVATYDVTTEAELLRCRYTITGSAFSQTTPP